MEKNAAFEKLEQDRFGTSFAFHKMKAVDCVLSHLAQLHFHPGVKKQSTIWLIPNELMGVSINWFLLRRQFW